MLNPKQTKFCVEYSKTGNATKSYQSAYGLSDVRACESAASRLLANNEVQKYLRELSAQVSDSTVADRQELMRFATSVLRGEIKSVVLDRDGNTVELPAQLKDRLKALELLSKLQGLFINRQELEISQSIPIVIKDNI